MKLIRKAKDERVIAEVNRIYKIGFNFLTVGILADIVLQVMNIHVEVHTPLASINLLEFGVVLVAQFLCLALMGRKGLMDDNAYAEADRYPWKHYLMQGILAGVSVCVLICVGQYFSGAAWASLGLGYALLVFLFQLVCIVPLTTIILLGITYVSFRYALRRRVQKEAVLGEDDD